MKIPKKYLSFFSALVVTIFSLGSIVKAAPLAEVYGWNYGPGNISTTGEAQTIESYLDFAGYDARSYLTSSAYYTRNTMGNDAIFYTAGHGAPGRILCRDSAGAITYLTANTSSDSTAYSLQSLFQGTDKLRDLRFAAFMSCETAKTNSTYGNLLDKCKELGVDVAIGYNLSVQDATAQTFDRYFMYALSAGLTVNQAYIDALTVTYNTHGEYGDVDSLQFKGAASDVMSVRITPAGFGTY